MEHFCKSNTCKNKATLVVTKLQGDDAIFSKTMCRKCAKWYRKRYPGKVEIRRMLKDKRRVQ